MSALLKCGKTRPSTKKLFYRDMKRMCGVKAWPTSSVQMNLMSEIKYCMILCVTVECMYLYFIQVGCINMTVIIVYFGLYSPAENIISLKFNSQSDIALDLSKEKHCQLYCVLSFPFMFLLLIKYQKRYFFN